MYLLLFSCINFNKEGYVHHTDIEVRSSNLLFEKKELNALEVKAQKLKEE
jgi:hypothetical protein